MAKGDGLIIMKPSSIVVAGGTASINADGGVDFSAATSLSLNGVFSSAYDNYVITFGSLSHSVDANLSARLRASGTDAAGASTYYYQTLNAVASTVSASRASADGTIFQTGGSTLRNGLTVHVYGPFLTQATAMRSVSASSYQSATITDIASTHSVIASYDGMTFIAAAGSISGSVVVMGYEE